MNLPEPLQDKLQSSGKYFWDLFEFAPISLWVEDFSEVKNCLEDLHLEGIKDLRAYLDEHPKMVVNCMSLIKVLDVNRKTLDLFKAQNKEDLLHNLGRILRDEMRGILLEEELLCIWENKLEFESEGVNYSLLDERIDISLQWSALPGFEDSLAKVLVSIEDITARKQAERALKDSELHFEGLFENAPVSLWEQDFSEVKNYLEGLRKQGITDLQQHLSENPAAIDIGTKKIVVLDVNRKTVELYGAKSKRDLLDNTSTAFRDEMHELFREELLAIWAGKIEFDSEGVNYTLNGERIDIHLRWAAYPGYEDSLARVLVSISDITARKRAETYLKYLGTHDVLTGLYNRAFFEEEAARLERGRHFPVSIIIADVDGLKLANDQYGHSAGDDLLRRVGEVLKAGFRSDDTVARIGGDEFAILLPDADSTTAELALARIRNLLMMNNSYYQGPPISISLGAATGERGCFLAEVQKRADDLMYQNKKKSRHSLLSKR